MCFRSTIKLCSSWAYVVVFTFPTKKRGTHTFFPPSSFWGFLLGSGDLDSPALDIITSSHGFHLLIFVVYHRKAKLNPYSVGP